VIDAMVTHLDIFPTICELAGVPAPERLEGTSLMPLVRGDVASLHDEIFTEMTFHAAYEPQRAVRTEGWKYIRRFDDYPHPVLANCDDSASKDLLVEQGWGRRTVDPEQLYNLVFDPGESRNVVAEPGNANIVAELRDRLERWMADRGDPLLEGPIEPPVGAEINEQDQTSADEPTRIVAAPTADPTGAPSR
jgi:arylsulfatase A-like enzyme